MKSHFVKIIKQIIRDFKYNKNSISGNKFSTVRNKTPFSSKRSDGLPRPKRTLRKSLQTGESGLNEGGSQCSEERSSGSGSTKGDRSDQFDSLETDSNSTGKGGGFQRRTSLDSGMHSNDSNSLSGSNRDSDPLNANGNNNIQRMPSEDDSVFDTLSFPLTPRSEDSILPSTNSATIAIPSHKEIQRRLTFMEVPVTEHFYPDQPTNTQADIASANRTVSLGAVSQPKRNSKRKGGKRGSLYDNMRCDSVEEEEVNLKDTADDNCNFVMEIPGAYIHEHSTKLWKIGSLLLLISKHSHNRSHWYLWNGYWLQGKMA